MSKITQGPAVAPHGLLKTSNNSNVAATPGSSFLTPDGRGLSYVLNGSVDLPAGVLVASPALVSADQGLAGSSAAIGDVAITLTTVGTIAAGYYVNGFLEVATGTGAGQRLKIVYNPAAAASSTVIITLEDAFFLATDTTSRFNLIADAYSNVVINPAGSPVAPIGVTVCPVPAGEYAYIQTSGDATVLSQGGTAAGSSLTVSASVDGAVATSAAFTDSLVGFAVNALTTAEYGTAYLQL